MGAQIGGDAARYRRGRGLRPRRQECRHRRPDRLGLSTLDLPDGMRFDDYLDPAGPAVGVLLMQFAVGLGAAMPGDYDHEWIVVLDGTGRTPDEVATPTVSRWYRRTLTQC